MAFPLVAALFGTGARVGLGQALKGGLSRVGAFLIPKSTFGKVLVGGATAYTLMPDGEKDENSMSMWKTAMMAAGVGGVFSAFSGGSFFKNAAAFGLAGAGLAWAANDLAKPDSTIKDIAKNFLDADSYEKIFGAESALTKIVNKAVGQDNTLKDMANPNAQDTQDRDKAQDVKNKDENANKNAVKFDANSEFMQKYAEQFTNNKDANQDAKLFLGLMGDKNLSDEQKLGVANEVLKQMPSERAEAMFGAISNEVANLNKQLSLQEKATNSVSGMDEREEQKLQEQVDITKNKIDKRNDILDKFGYGNINQQAQAQNDAITAKADNALANANELNGAASLNSLNEAANAMPKVENTQDIAQEQEKQIHKQDIKKLA